MREAYERLLVVAVHAQDQSDEARADAARARAELDDLMSRLQDANARLATAAAYAQTMAEAAAARQEEYRQLSSRPLTLQDEERRRLALDLHDSTAQCLAALTMNLDVIEGTGEALDARARRALAESRSLAEQCTSNADHGQAQSPLDERARAVRDPQPHHRTVKDGSQDIHRGVTAS
jgi:signal transduction histidine kinase